MGFIACGEKMTTRRLWLFLWATGLLIVLAWGAANQQPALAYTSDQATRGAQVYAFRCSTCHGDVGQGLAKWRLTWDDLHQNCSNPKCHGRQHPPEGFYLPDNYAPAIMGENTLTRFQTARDLHAFISTRMPYQLPGTLDPEDYWSLTAFLLREHGVKSDGNRLDASNAGSVSVNPGSDLPITLIAFGVVVLGALALGFVLIARRWRATRTNSKSPSV